MRITEWDGHAFGSNYTVGLQAGGAISLPSVEAIAVKRMGRWPLFGALDRQARTLYLGITIDATPLSTYRDYLMRWFDPEDEEPKQLVATDDDGTSNERYVEAVCLGLFPKSDGEKVTSSMYIAVLSVSGDVRWRSTSNEEATDWNITSTGQTKVVSNTGKDDAFPILTITPTTGKTGGFGYKRWVPIHWKASVGYTNYPYDTTNGGLNTAALVTGGKAQADGDDFRVYVNGVQKDRWFGASTAAFNTTVTKVWVNLTFQADVPMTLKTAIASSGDLTSIDVNESISSMPASGIVIIDSEAFTYTSKNDGDKKFTGITRAAKGTSMAAHTASTSVIWIQHDVWWFYDNSSLTAPTQDDDYKPAFDLDTSTNTSWDYNNFGEHDGQDELPRSGRWSYVETADPYDRVYPYYGNQYTQVNGPGMSGNPDGEHGEIGIFAIVSGSGVVGRHQLYHPAGITAANFQNGEKRATDGAGNMDMFSEAIGLQSSADGVYWDDEYDIPDPTVADTWQSWSQNLTSLSVKYIALRADATQTALEYFRVECSDVTVSLNSSYTPAIALTTTEQGCYELDCLLTNQTTGDIIGVALLMATDESLEIDTYDKVITLLDDGSKHLEALTIINGPRREWLKLLPGNNTLRFDDTGTNAVTIEIGWAKRDYA